MIRSYTINELEELTAVNKRTISDYITKGLLTGPSHRGRGAVYSQRDFNVLRVIPKLRTLLKGEFGSLKAVAAFLGQLSLSDIQLLAARNAERAFVVEVRRLRVRLSLMGLMPHVSPEKFDEVLDQLSPEQICSVDSGRIQIGAVINLSQLFAYEHMASGNGVPVGSVNGRVNGSANRSINGTSDQGDTDQLPRLSEELMNARDLEETIPARSESRTTTNGKESSASAADTKRLLTLKLDEIANRLDRVEQMLDYETGT